MNQRDAENPPRATTKLQQLRDIFNQNGLNYSQIVGDELTVVSMELQDFNWSLEQIATLLTNHDHTRLQELLEALPEKVPNGTIDEGAINSIPWEIGYEKGWNNAIDEMEAAIKRVYGGLDGNSE